MSFNDECPSTRAQGPTDFGFRISDFGFRIVDSGFRITNCGLRITTLNLIAGIPGRSPSPSGEGAEGG